jgi:hypothetical protein
LNRRDFLRLSALAVPIGLPALASCSNNSKPPAGSSTTAPPAAAGSLEQLVTGGDGLLRIGDAQGENLVGSGRVAFGLRSDTNEPVTDAAVTVYVGRQGEQDKPPVAQAQASWLQGEVATMALYVATVTFSTPGEWLMGVQAKTTHGKTLNGGTALTVLDRSPSPVPGQRAIAVPTPTTDNPMNADPLCSNVPVCSMHATSLDVALNSGKPTVVTFAAPAYCQSETCGPVVRLVDAAAKKASGMANFIHVEAYDKDSVGTLTKPVAAWKFQLEPWTYFIDAKGIVKDRIPGAFGDTELAQRVAALGIKLAAAARRVRARASR